MIVFVDAHRAQFGVAPICRVLSQHGVPIASSTYYAARSRPRSARSIGDEAMLAEITRVHADLALGAACTAPVRCGTSCAARAPWLAAAGSNG